MTNRELLELAAKAAGLHIKGHQVDYNDTFTHLVVGAKFTKQKDKWNPLTEDGDALRLAVKLGLTLVIESDMVFCRNQKTDKAFREQYSKDPYAATRRAVVRAAAEIGREMT